MTLRLHDTMTGRKTPFEPMDPAQARIYVCGPTVYDFSHLGHARCYVVYDVLVRHLRASGLEVKYVRNITDIDDKILARAGENGEAPSSLAERFTEAYRADMRRLGNLDPDVEPKVSEHLDAIRALIGRLLDAGAAYVSEGDVYFDVQSFPEYGKLSHRRLADLAAGASGRTDDGEARRKRHPADFALWKGAAAGEPHFWDSPWGPGRPGWHIECSAMSLEHLGETFDLHGGGLDLVFPHHENEIAQSEAASGKPLARRWMHNGFVEVNKEKMSKSLGNFFTARELFERVEPEAVRYVMLTMHYRAPLHLDWTIDEDGHVTGFPQFEEAERRLEYLYATKARLAQLPAARIVAGEAVPDELAGFTAALQEALDDDLNMPVALAKTHELLRATNELCDRALAKKGSATRGAVEAANAAFGALSARLGIGGDDAAAVTTRIRDRRARTRGIDPHWVEARIAARTDARAHKDFAAADRVRDELATLGVTLLDGAAGTSWSIPT